jgi:N-acetylneuraminic acid mutarotase
MFLKTFGILILIGMSGAVCAQPLPALPEAVSNNAVAKVKTEQGDFLLSFMGLAKGKTYQDVHNKVWSLKIEQRGVETQSNWLEMSPVPSSLPLKGRLASIAAGIKEKAYIFGGYTVGKDHSEVSSPDNFVYQVLTDSYQKIARMPVPVDDAVALVYQDRYIYLISGWHNDGNVNLVQLYDSKTDSWQQASPFLGVPVFGHAGGIVDGKMLICDGVKVQAREGKRRTFVPEPACYTGFIDKANPLKIDWREVKHPTGKAKYRMAATGVNANKRIVFFGGSANPYNYNGIGYDGKPSQPSDATWTFDLLTQQWQLSKSEFSSMDHRGMLLLELNGALRAVTLGGIGKNQKSLSDVKLMSIW